MAGKGYSIHSWRVGFYLVFMGIVVFLFACTRADRFEQNLTDTTKHTYWTRIVKKSNGHYEDLHDRFEFNSDGTARVYYVMTDTGKSFILRGVEGELGYTWHFNPKDSTFNLGVLVYKIAKWSPDSIIFDVKGTNAKIVFRRSKKRLLR